MYPEGNITQYCNYVAQPGVDTDRHSEKGPSRRRALQAITTLGFALVGGAASAGESHPANLDLTRYRGKVVYLDFWASWCAPCKISFPYMERLAYAYSGKPLVIIAVNVDHSRERADAFLSQVRGALPVIYDEKGALARAYGVKEMPTSILIDRKGRVRYVNKGFFAEQMPLYEARISELLNER